MAISKTLQEFSSSSHQQMFTIQGLLHLYKDRVCGPNLEYPSYSYEDFFKQSFVRKQMSTAWILILVGYWNDEKNEKKGYSHILLIIKMLFNYQITCPFIVTLTCTNVYKKCPNPRIFPFFPEAQVLWYFGPVVLACHFILKLTEHGTILT